MNIFEIILISLGMSLDIFAWVIMRSSSYSRIDHKKLIPFGLAFAIWELVSLELGYWTVELMEYRGIIQSGSHLIHFLAIIIILSMAVRMAAKGFQNIRVIESRHDEVDFLQLMKDNMLMGFRTYLIGIAFDACNTPIVTELLILTVVALIMVFAGLYVGYRYGYEFKQKAYFIGAALLLAAGISVMISFF